MRTERGVSFVVAVVMIIGLVASLTGVSYLATNSAVGGTTSSVAPVTEPVLPASVLDIASSGSNKIVSSGDPDMPQGVLPNPASGSASETNLGYKEAQGPTYGDHVVISEFATRSASSGYDEFVELYNPTASDIDVGNWNIWYYNGTIWTYRSGYLPDNLLTIGTIPAGTIIKSCGFLLWADNRGYVSPGSGPTPDWTTYGNGMSDGSGPAPRGIQLRLVDNVTVVDTVLYMTDGGSYHDEAEGDYVAPAPSPLGTSQGAYSTERKANAASTAATMTTGGVDEFKGNSYDSQVNSGDWIRQTNGRKPQDNASSIEIPDNSYPLKIEFTPGGYSVYREAQQKLFTVTVTNYTGQGHWITLENTATHSWPLSTVSDNIYVPGNGGWNTATLTVDIPADALVGDPDTITVKATAQDDSLLTITNCCTVAVVSMPVNLVLTPHDDAELQEENPDSPQNSADTRDGARTHSGSLNHRSYIKFDLSAIPPNAVINDAILRLYLYSSSSYTNEYIAGITDHVVKKVANDSWDEETLSWNTAEYYSPLGDNVNNGDNLRSVILANGSYLNKFLDITDYVKTSFEDRDSLISLGLRCIVENYDAVYRYGYYDSKEYSADTTLWPELRLSFVAENITVKITPDNYRQYPGAGRSFDVTVKNWGMNAYTVNLNVENTLPWPVSLDNTHLTLDVLASQTVKLTVDVPAGASIGAVDTITVTGIAEEDPTNCFASDSCNMVASRWVSESSSLFVHDYAASVVGVGDYIYIATSDTFLNVNAFMRYNTISECWENLDVPWWNENMVASPNKKNFKNGAAMAWDGGNYIYALCGASYAIDNKEFARYNISTGKWENLENTPGVQGAGDGIAVGSNGLVYAMTGRTNSNDSSQTRGTVFARYDPATGIWDNTLPEPWTNTDDGAALVAVGDNIYATQGEIYEWGTDVTAFKVYSSGSWISRAAFPEGEADGTSLAYPGSGDYIYALGGSNYAEQPGIKFYRYKISTNTWEQLENVPSGVYNQNGARLAYSNGNMFYWVGVYRSGGYFDEEGKKLYRYPLNDYAVAVNVFPSPYPSVYSLSNAGASEAQPKSGGILDYVVDVRNMGLKSDTYNLENSDSATPDWPMVLVPTQFTGVGSGLKVSAKLSVTIPAGALVGDVDTITVTATGNASNSGITQARKISMAQLPSDDSYTYQYSGAANYGSVENISVGRVAVSGAGSFEQRDYFQFNLSGIPSGATITSAKLWVWCYATDNNPTIEAYSTSDGWTEGGITWNNQPAENALLDTLYVPRNTKDTWLVFDVTSFIGTEYAGDENASIVLQGKWAPYSASIKLKSKEYDNAQYQPFLEITYTTVVPFTLNLRAGWNMVSFPILPDNTDPDSMFSGYYAMFKWNAAGQSYVLSGGSSVEPDEPIAPGVGYWVYVLANENVAVSGTPVDNLTLSMGKGWNLIGPPLGGASIANPDDTPDNSVLPFAFTWTGSAYQLTTDLVAGAGYWVYALNSCVLRLPGGA